MMADLFIPTLHSFAMGNIFTGSCGDFRFRIDPKVVKMESNDKEVDMETSSIFVEYWHGPLCYKMSKMEGQNTFPMSDEGRLSLKAWLEENV